MNYHPIFIDEETERHKKAEKLAQDSELANKLLVMTNQKQNVALPKMLITEKYMLSCQSLTCEPGKMSSVCDWHVVPRHLKIVNTESFRTSSILYAFCIPCTYLKRSGYLLMEAKISSPLGQAITDVN